MRVRLATKSFKMLSVPINGSFLGVTASDLPSISSSLNSVSDFALSNPTLGKYELLIFPGLGLAEYIRLLLARVEAT